MQPVETHAVDPVVVMRGIRLVAAHPLQFLAISAVGLAFNLLGIFLRGGIWSTPLSIVSPLGGELVAAALIFAVATAANGGSPDVLNSFATAVQRIGRLVIVSLWWIGSTLVLAGTIVGLPFAFRQFIRWSFGVHGVMLRDLNRRDALSLSGRVVDGHWWQWFALWVSVTIPAGLIAWLPIIITWSYSTGPLLISSLIGVVGGPIIVSVMTLAYLECLEHLEALDGPAAA